MICAREVGKRKGRRKMRKRNVLFQTKYSNNFFLTHVNYVKVTNFSKYEITREEDIRVLSELRHMTLCWSGCVYVGIKKQKKIRNLFFSKNNFFFESLGF